MSLALTQNFSAVVPGLGAFFLGVGGTEPYVYTVQPNGAGGTIDPDTGAYQSPSIMGDTPKKLSDTILVTDDNGDTATASILVGNPLFLFCEILEKEMELSQGRVYLWDQKIPQFSDDGLYIAVSVVSCTPFGNTISFEGGGSGLDGVQSVNMKAKCDINIMSRGPSARDRKEEIILALGSVYAQQQQEANSFLIGKLPANSSFLNLSVVDGAAIPYRFQISVNLQYMLKKTKAVPYFDTFASVQVATNP